MFNHKYFLVVSILMHSFIIISCINNSDIETATNNTTETTEIEKDNNELQYPEYKITGLPTVIIDTNGVEIVDKENWVQGSMSIENQDEMFDDFINIPLFIKGRGNSTWRQAPKKPYAIKFEKKQSVFGMPKHKRWVLIANYFDNTFIKNELAFYLSRTFELDYTVNGHFVNLVLNDEYIGLYWLGEAIKVDKSRVNINDTKDFLIELSGDKEDKWVFESSIKKQNYIIKNDDYMNEERFTFVQNKISDLESILYNDYFPYKDESREELLQLNDKIDLESFAKMYLVEQIMNNRDFYPNEIGSAFLTLNSDTGLLRACTVWDFDAAYIYEWPNLGPSKWDGLVYAESLYYDALFKLPEFCEIVKNILKEQSNLYEKCEIFIDNLALNLQTAIDFDIKRWGMHNDRSTLYVYMNYRETQQFIDYVKRRLKTSIELVKNTYEN